MPSEVVAVVSGKSVSLAAADYVAFHKVVICRGVL